MVQAQSVDIRIALWHCSNGIAWVELFRGANGRYYCLGKHGGQNLGSVENDDIAEAMVSEMIAEGQFDPPAITWNKARLHNERHC